MQRATAIVRKAAVKTDKVTGTVVLAHEDRQRRRAVLKTVAGTEFLLDLDKASVIDEGDAVRLEDGSLIAVHAAPEALLEIRAENPLRLMRVAWHIGNRHTPAEITSDALYIEDDHVLAEMIRGQGCSITKVTRPFRPERGAYDHANDHHAHDDDHEAHANPAHGQPGHVHGPDCGHDHGHDHTHDVLKVASHGHDHDHKPNDKHDHDHGKAHDHEHKHHHGHDHGHATRAKHDH
ncbi:MAG: urease accessory protein UreE [Bosea sp. (in: a-proteobacteria)]